MNDRFATYFKNKDWKKGVEPLETNQTGTKMTNMPQSREVQRMRRQKEVAEAEVALTDTNKQYKKKVENLKKRLRDVRGSQENLKNNLVKFNNFVREKQLKVAIENRKREEEIAEQSQLANKFKENQESIHDLERDKGQIQETVKMKKIFREFLESVVSDESSRNRYKDIEELIKRCETLVATRDDLLRSQEDIIKKIKAKESVLEKIRKEQNEKMVKLKHKQDNLGNDLSEIERKKTKLKIIHDRNQNEITQTRLLIANIRLSIQTLWQYVQSRKVILPSDTIVPKMEKLKDKSFDKLDKKSQIEEQIDSIYSHIVDLKVVIDRVDKDESASNYQDPVPTEKFDLRIDH